MKLMAKLMALIGLTAVVMIRACVAHSDQVCMVCPCGRCAGMIATCCARFRPNPLTRLHVAVNCSQPGLSRIIDPRTSPSLRFQSSSCSGFHLVHEYSCLTAFPDNYCKFGATRAVSLRRNRLHEFPDLKCLPHLGLLDLRHNKLTAVPRDAFRGLENVREIFLDYNDITYIHPSAFEAMTELSIFSVSYNRLTTVDAWPLSMHHDFCVFDFSHNQLRHLSNRAHWKLNMSKTVVYGPGFLDFSYNRFEDGPVSELSQFGINKIIQLAKFIFWGFDFRHNPFRCDCTFYSAAKWAKKLAGLIWRDYFNVTCGNPPSLRGLPLIHIPLKAFVCNVTTDCPPGCYCEDQPAENATIVFCDSVSLRSLPDALPEGNHLVIHMANNSVESLPPRQYLTRTKMIDLRGSGLRDIEEDTPHLLKHAKLVDLRDSELHHLPSSFQVLDPGVVRLDLHTLKCSCDLDWMPGWLHHSATNLTNGLENITCVKEDGERILLISATEHHLCDVKAPKYPTVYKISMIVSVSVLTVVTLVLLVFRHEVLVMGQSCRARCTQRRKKLASFHNVHRFDVFVSMNINSQNDTEWVENVLLPSLNFRDLNAYLPLRDCPVGSVEMDELTKRMQDSATALVVLSADYAHSPSCLFQFRQAYSHMIAGRRGNLLVVRRGGQLSRRSVREPRLRAMLTLSMVYSADTDHLHKALDTLLCQRETEM